MTVQKSMKQKIILGLSSAVLLSSVQEIASADSYTVQAGDSFYGIASQFGVSAYDLASSNGKTIFDTIHPGEVLQVHATATSVQSSVVASSNFYTTTSEEDVVLNTPTDSGNSYPVGQCTWGVKEMAPWASNWWGNAKDWAANASASGFAIGRVPVVGAIAVWDGGEYGHVAYVTDVASTSLIQVMESNYKNQKAIGQYRSWFDPTTFYGNVTYIYPNS